MTEPLPRGVARVGTAIIYHLAVYLDGTAEERRAFIDFHKHQVELALRSGARTSIREPRQRSNSPGLKLRFSVLERDRFTCQYCGRAAPDVELHVDHIKPKSRGGTSISGNLITSCRDCNLGKGDRLISGDLNKEPAVA